jgi:hypothetical protein
MFETELLYDVLVSPVWSNQPDITKNAHHKAVHCSLLEAETDRMSGYQQTPERLEDMRVPCERERLFV